MRNLCATLGMDYHDGMVTPYEDIELKMTDGIYPESTPMGDTELLKRDAIDPSVADNWRGVVTDDFLSDLTWDLAQSFGYSRPHESGDLGAEESATTDVDDDESVVSRQRRRRARRRAFRDVGMDL